MQNFEKGKEWTSRFKAICKRVVDLKLRSKDVLVKDLVNKVSQRIMG